MLEIATEENGVLLTVKIVPGASRTRYMGELDGRAKFAVSAPPEKGKANKALIEFLATLLDVPKRRLAVVSGHTSAEKKIRIEGVTIGTVRAALQPGRS